MSNHGCQLSWLCLHGRGTDPKWLPPLPLLLYSGAHCSWLVFFPLFLPTLVSFFFLNFFLLNEVLRPSWRWPPGGALGQPEASASQPAGSARQGLCHLIWPTELSSLGKGWREMEKGGLHSISAPFIAGWGWLLSPALLLPCETDRARLGNRWIRSRGRGQCRAPSLLLASEGRP